MRNSPPRRRPAEQLTAIDAAFDYLTAAININRSCVQKAAGDTLAIQIEQLTRILPSTPRVRTRVDPDGERFDGEYSTHKAWLSALQTASETRLS